MLITLKQYFIVLTPSTAQFVATCAAVNVNAYSFSPHHTLGIVTLK
jgi:hypothetical protein